MTPQIINAKMNAGGVGSEPAQYRVLVQLSHPEQADAIALAYARAKQSSDPVLTTPLMGALVNNENISRVVVQRGFQNGGAALLVATNQPQRVFNVLRRVEGVASIEVING